MTPHRLQKFLKYMQKKIINNETISFKEKLIIDKVIPCSMIYDKN